MLAFSACTVSGTVYPRNDDFLKIKCKKIIKKCVSNSRSRFNGDCQNFLHEEQRVNLAETNQNKKEYLWLVPGVCPGTSQKLTRLKMRGYN